MKTDRPTPRLRYAWRFVILSLGALHTSMAILRQSMGADGINYLQIGEAFWRGDWSLAINGVWSPLYGVLAGGVLALVSPEMSWVFPIVQVFNFGVFLGSLAAFEFFWREAWLIHRTPQEAEGRIGFPPWLWWSLGYSLFVWSSLNLIEIWSVTPDMLVSVSVYLSAGFLIRTIRGGGQGPSVALGITLGLGYLAKAPMFPLSLVCFGLAALAIRRPREAMVRLAPAVMAFILVAGPLAITLSIQEGHPTFSEVSRFTYLKHVNRIPFPQWRAEDAKGLGVPLHPPVLAHDSPAVYDFSGPVRGTYPPSFDPDYFTEGLVPRVSLSEQLNALSFNLAFYFRLFFRTQGAFLGIAVLLSLFCWKGLAEWRNQGGWLLSFWALACFAMYSAVFVTERYVAPFAVLFWAGVLVHWRLEPGRSRQRLLNVAGVLMSIALLANVGAFNLEGFASVAGLQPPVEGGARSQFSDGPSASPVDVAEALMLAGVSPGEDVGLIGYGYTALWAHLAGVRIVSEMVPEEAPLFWTSGESVREAVLGAFLASGASHVVAEVHPPTDGGSEGWNPLGQTGYWILALGNR